MPSIDERIKAELERDEAQMDTALGDSKGLNDMVWDAFRAGPRRWLVVVASLTAVFSLVLIYLLVKFSYADTVADQIFWGVWSILAAIAVITFELWSWMQINRVSLRREIKQLELGVQRLLDEK